MSLLASVICIEFSKFVLTCILIVPACCIVIRTAVQIKKRIEKKHWSMIPLLQCWVSEEFISGCEQLLLLVFSAEHRLICYPVLIKQLAVTDFNIFFIVDHFRRDQWIIVPR